MAPGRRHADGRDRRGAAIGGHRNRLDVDEQRQRPAHVAVLEQLVLGVEDQRRQRRVGMRVGEVPEPGARGFRLLRQREHAFRRDVVDDVELVVHLRDDALVRRTGVDIGEVFRARLAEAAERGALPILAQLPDVPLAVGVVAVEHVGAERDRLVEVELLRILDLLEDVLRHDPDRVPAHREQHVEAGVRLLQLEDDGIGIGRLHLVDVEAERRAPAHAAMLDLRRDGVHHVRGRELDAVAPVDAAAQLHRHLGEVGIVDRLLGGERIVPDAVDAAIGIDVPERVERRLLQAVRLAAGVDRPDVEPAGVLDRAFRILEDERLVARQVARDALSRSRARDGGKARDEPAGQNHDAHAHEPSSRIACALSQAFVGEEPSARDCREQHAL